MGQEINNNNNIDLFLGNIEDWHDTLLQPLNPVDYPQTQQTFSKQYSLVVIRDHSSTNHNSAAADFSVFPPSNHENLTPSHFNHDPKHHPPPSPSSPLSFLPSVFDDDSPSPPPPPPPPVTLLPKWWSFAVQILRSRIGPYFGCSTVKCSAFWSFKNVALVVTAVFWWLCVRLRQQRRRKSVEHLMQIINEKDKKIMQLLNQIAQMNEVFLTRHKVLASKLPN
ncbi:uncharacterized protein LOC107260914 [Ricinus communis]|uniref:uncharacterized protein LOC107260914 n=1 Tax=Ricinus communis TaxID=3988 RepID=UPI0007723A56|nr:uncharacterized protein LOC107260914 [Ricinus communis]|eukprot:XP_015571986.1 uncharacterized protein LOC107260914 [Ricinus communis]